VREGKLPYYHHGKPYTYFTPAHERPEVVLPGGLKCGRFKKQNGRENMRPSKWQSKVFRRQNGCNMAV
jgi:hypothetical protein